MRFFRDSHSVHMPLVCIRKKSKFPLLSSSDSSGNPRKSLFHTNIPAISVVGICENLKYTLVTSVNPQKIQIHTTRMLRFAASSALPLKAEHSDVVKLLVFFYEVIDGGFDSVDGGLHVDALRHPAPLNATTEALH